MDEDTYEVRRGGVPVELTATEYKLLRYLMLNPRRVLSKAQILDRVWNYDFGGDANVVEIYISYLRKKLDAARTAADPHRARVRVLPARDAGLAHVAAAPTPARPRRPRRRRPAAWPTA